VRLHGKKLQNATKANGYFVLHILILKQKIVMERKSGKKKMGDS